MDGLLLIDKPKGWTSFDVVAKVRGICSQHANHKVKVGHAGTLDPMATGLLIIMLGNYTKKAEEFLKKDKIYEVKLKLGYSSSTDDSEGQISQISNQEPSQEDVDNALKKFIGEILQTPPSYSAIKIDGKRAYKLAREGKEVKIEPRKVKIYSITSVQYDYPDVSFVANVSSGTYIRSLARDLGEKLGVGAYLTDLRRTRIDDYTLEQAISVDQLNISTIKEHLKLLN